MANTSNYLEQGGARTVIGGSLDVVSGGDLDIESGGAFKIAGVQVTASAAQLNAVSSILTVANKTGAELTKGTLVYISGYDATLDAPTVTKSDADDGTKKAQYVVTAAIANNATGTVDDKCVVTGLNTNSYTVGDQLYESGTAGAFTDTAPTAADDDRIKVGVVKVKSATVGEVYFDIGGYVDSERYLNSVTAGTAAASQAVVLDANKHVDEVNTASLKLGASGSTVAVTSTAAELNTVDGKAAGCTYTIGAEAANVINCGFQIEDAAGGDLAERACLFAYLSDDANGDSIAASAPDGGVAVGTDGLAIPVVTSKAWMLTCESDGNIDLDITESGAATWYMILVLPNGELVASAAITFAA